MILKYYKIIANHQQQIFGHMGGRIYLTVDAFLAAQGWKTWREHTPLMVLNNHGETAIVRAALLQAGISIQGASATTAAP